MAKQKLSGLLRERALLRLMAREPTRGHRLAALVDGSGLGKSTAHRLLSGLKGVGLVEQDQETRLYSLGFELFALGQAAAARFTVAELARPALHRLAARFEDTLYLALPHGLDSVCVARVEGAFPIKTLTLQVGDHRPLGAGSGALALLSFRSEAEMREVVLANADRYARFPELTTASVMSAAEATRRRGHAFTDGFLVPGMRGVGVPVFDADGNAVAAITLSAVTSRMQPDRCANVVAAIRRETQAIEELLRRGHGSKSAQRGSVAGNRR